MSATTEAAARPPAAPRGAGVVALVVATILFAGALVLRSRLDPWRSTAVAAIVGGGLAWWVLGARLRSLFAITTRGAVIAIAMGVALVAATHGAYQLAASLSPALAGSVHGLYASVDVGSSPVALATLTAIVVLGEELVWRGVAIEVAAGAGGRLVIGASSVVLYVVPQLAAGVPLLIVAAAVLGALFAAQRLITGRLTDPVLTHVVWSVAVFVVVPLA